MIHAFRRALFLFPLVFSAGVPSDMLAEENDSLHTDFRVLVGHPDPAGQKGSVQVLPWSVVVGEIAAARYVADLERVIERLRSGYRLSRLRLSDSTTCRLNIGEEAHINSPSPTLDIRAKLLAFDSEKALYQVRLTDGGKLKAEPKVTVVRGGRAIIGGQNGDDAPYVFLIIEPAGKSARGESEEGMAPRLLERVEPVYPNDAAAERVQGIVLLRCFIAEDGHVKVVEPIKSPDKRLTDSAINAVRQWRYAQPKDSKGKPVEVEVTITVAYTLDTEDPPPGSDK